MTGSKLAGDVLGFGEGVAPPMGRPVEVHILLSEDSIARIS